MESVICDCGLKVGGDCSWTTALDESAIVGHDQCFSDIIVAIRWGQEQIAWCKNAAAVDVEYWWSKIGRLEGLDGPCCGSSCCDEQAAQ